MKLKQLVEHGGVLHRPRIAESEGQATESRKKWTASVWKLDQRNLNGRTYPTALAQRLVKENPSTMAYDGHEAASYTGGEYAIAKAVCSNPRIESGELRVDIDFVDDGYRALLERLIDSGVKIGVSSVGYGWEDEHGVVDASSYVLIRFLDFVTCPAGEVYATVESKQGEPEHPGAPMGDTGADKAMAERRAKVASELRKIYLGV